MSYSLSSYRICSASGMFVSNDNTNFKAFLQKFIYSFTTRLSSSSNKLICVIEQSCIMKSLIQDTRYKYKTLFKLGIVI